MTRPQGSNYQAWFDQIQTKYPDAYAYTIGANGWSTLNSNDKGPTLTPHMSGPHYTDVSAASYSKQRLVGTFDHNLNSGKIFAPL